MPITAIRLQNFRSYRDEIFEFENSVNIIIGHNASGKTNLLAAIQLVCLGRAYSGNDAETIKFNKPWTRIELTTDQQTRIAKIAKIDDSKVAKSFIVDNQIIKRLGSAKILPTVLFEPNHLQLLIGGPDLRRDYLDDLIDQNVIGYNLNRVKYRRALSQRNTLLKKGLAAAKNQIFSWDIRLSQLAGEIVHQRLKLIKQLNTEAQNVYKKLSRSKSRVEIEYESSISTQNYESKLLKKLKDNLELDVLRGFTAQGPHRDDFAVLINGRPAQKVASRGENRTLLLTLKIIEAYLLEKVHDQRPIFLLDDVYSELDIRRRRDLTSFLKPYQIFITTTDAETAIQHFTHYHLIPLSI